MKLQRRSSSGCLGHLKPRQAAFMTALAKHLEDQYANVRRLCWHQLPRIYDSSCGQRLRMKLQLLSPQIGKGVSGDKDKGHRCSLRQEPFGLQKSLVAQVTSLSQTARLEAAYGRLNSMDLSLYLKPTTFTAWSPCEIHNRSLQKDVADHLQ